MYVPSPPCTPLSGLRVQSVDTLPIWSGICHIDIGITVNDREHVFDYPIVRP